MGLINSKRNTNTTNGVERDEVKYSNPNGLYPTCSWDMKVVKKLILEKKLAPFYPGTDERKATDSDECPICFLFYTGGLNNSRCCKKGLCTECFLQIKKPNTPLSESTCPFCNRNKFTVVFTGPKKQEERQKEEEEEQKVLLLQQKMREDEIERDKEREKQRQAQKGKEKAKASEGEPDRKPSDAKHDQAPAQGDKGKEHEKPPKSRKGKGETHNERRNAKSLPGPSETSAEATPLGPSSYPPIVQGGSSSPEKDLEDLMLMEAIRLSLMESDNAHAKHSPRKENTENEGNSGPKSPFTELFGVEGEGNDFETRVKSGGTGIVRRPVSTTGGGDGGYDSSSESEDEEVKEKGEVEARARRGRTPSTTVPIEDTPLGKSDKED